MSSQKSSHIPTGIGPVPIQDVLLVERFVRTEPGLRFEATSLPGHLLQLVVRGRVHQECNGRHYDLQPGSVIWYHEDELVRGTVREWPWVFYSVNFIAPTLPPPAFENRVFARQQRLAPVFAALHRCWRARDQAEPARSFRVYARLLEILAALSPAAKAGAVSIDPGSRLWWELETECRRDLRRPLRLETLAELAQRSPATVSRSCQQAVGMSPMRRLKQVRLSLARGLVRQSGLAMKEIADRVGYARVHEFSRDYHKAFGLAPTKDRAR